MGQYITALIHDDRLYGGTPYNLYTPDAAIRINSSTSLGGILKWIEMVGENIGYIDELHIMAHGNEDTNDPRVQLGKDEMTRQNLHRWSEIAGYVDWIKLYACKIADGVKGKQFCSDLAYFSGSWLTASKDKQIVTKFFKGGPSEPGPWEGKIYSWDYNGNQCAKAYE